MKKVTIDPHGTGQLYFGVIIQDVSGIVYSQQCGGTACEQREIEGYFIPIGGLGFSIKNEETVTENHEDDPGFEIEKGHINQLLSVFHKANGGCLWGKPSVEQLARLRAVIEKIQYKDENGRETWLLLNDAKLDEILEAWVPVITLDGQGILTWPNCD